MNKHLKPADKTKSRSDIAAIAFRHSPYWVIVFQGETVISFNPRAIEKFGEKALHEPRRYFPAEHFEELKTCLDKRHSHPPVSWDYQDKKFEVTYYYYGGADDLVFVYGYEITDHAKSQDTLKSLAQYDSLTGLANRKHFDDYTTDALRTHRVGIIMLDIDDFKVLNDTFGHSAGDACLKEFARRLPAEKKGVRLPARIGGDEFAIVVLFNKQMLHSQACDELSQLAESIKTAMEPTFDLGKAGSSHVVTTSIGIAVSSKTARDLGNLLERADMAMYHAKKKGGTAFSVYNGTMTETSRHRRAPS